MNSKTLKEFLIDAREALLSAINKVEPINDTTEKIDLSTITKEDINKAIEQFFNDKKERKN